MENVKYVKLLKYVMIYQNNRRFIMYTKEELLRLAGKLAISCQALLNSNTRTIGFYINEMEKTLYNYNSAIFSNLNESAKEVNNE